MKDGYEVELRTVGGGRFAVCVSSATRAERMARRTFLRVATAERVLVRAPDGQVIFSRALAAIEARIKRRRAR